MESHSNMMEIVSMSVGFMSLGLGLLAIWLSWAFYSKERG
jgi:hypothetical protein